MIKINLKKVLLIKYCVKMSSEIITEVKGPISLYECVDFTSETKRL